MTSTEATTLSLLKDTVLPCSPAELSLSDYGHIQSTLDVLTPFLKEAIQTARKGVNIFIHGAPGTGKTQLVKCLAHALNIDLFEVASEDEDGDPVVGSYRLRAYRAAQSFFSNMPSFILFDEVEDVFDDGDHSSSRRNNQSRKAWINRTLEENAVPAFWLSNSVHCLDPAYVRRFDMIFEIPVPPRSQRLRILDKHCTATISHNTRNRIAENTQLAPAVVAKASSVIRTVENSLQPAQLEAAFELILANTLKAQGHKPVNKDPTMGATVRYDPSCTNADVDLADLATQLKQTQSGRICLYGPPGTGKTAYGHWLAEQLEKPLMLKKASDLISKYLGETEQNLAQAFRDAEQDNAVLLIDEVDSFLQNRESATRSWEVSQVNELLTQLEAFNGVFIASTNLMGQLDAASLRRFDLKIRFDYLRPAQADELFERYCSQLNLSPVGSDSLELAEPHKLKQLNTLTPGDFAAVARQSRLRPLRTQQALVNALAQECALKPGARQTPIGFLVA
jgi:transitional endoplasmic reticulum ATPase